MHIAAIVIGFILDYCFGDPHWLPHPIRLIGSLITILEKFFRSVFPASRRFEQIGGILLALIVMFLSFGVSFFILAMVFSFNFWLGFLAECLMCYQILAAKCLKVESMKVAQAMKENNLLLARQKLSMIVGRDTQNLSGTQVIKAAIETVAENTSDGVIAPLFFLFIGGAPLGFLYKAVNTMDSMIGYTNKRYYYFGRFAAKLDDWLNFVPARLSAFIMLLAAAIQGLDVKNGWRVFMRDRYKHKSPNSAHTESVCAGVLNVQLAGDAYYFGELHHKPTIGDDERPVVIEDISTANQLMYSTALLTIIFLGIARIMLMVIIF